MKKKWIWGAAVVLVLALSLGLYWLFTAGDYRRALPSRPLALASVDWVRLSDENGMGMQDWKKLLPEGLEPGQAGIDWSKEMYAFVSSKEYVGLLAAVSDEADLRRLLDEAARKGRCTPVEDYRGYSWTVWGGSWMMGFGEGALLMMGPGLKAGMDALRYDMLTCLRQKEAESGMSSPLFSELDSVDASFRVVSRLDVLPNFRGVEFLEGLPGHANLSDVYLCAGLSLSPHGVTMVAEISSQDSDVNKYYEQMAFLGKPLDGEFAGRVPEDALAWACVNVEGGSLLEMLRQNPVVRTFLIGLNLCVDADLIIRSIKGDVAVTVPASALQNPGNVLVTAHLAEKDFLKEAAYWRESAARSGTWTFRDFGNGRFYLAANGVQAYFGVDGETLYVTPEEEMKDWASNPETETLSEWDSRIKDSRFFLWVNLEQVKRAPMVDASWRESGMDGGRKILDMFDAIVLSSSDARRLTLELHTRGSRNLLKDLSK